MKDDDYISWHEFFMGVAELAAKRSKDPNTKVGACVVNSNNIILSTGYNGMPIGCNDDDMPWCRDGSFENSKYAYVCHAELNAILNCDGRSLNGSILYVTNFPCNECAKAIIQAGIKKVIFKEDKYPSSDITRVSKGLLKVCGIEVVSYATCESESVETLFFHDGTPPKKIYRDKADNLVKFDGDDYKLSEDMLGPVKYDLGYDPELPKDCLSDIDVSGYDGFVGHDRAPEYEDRNVIVTAVIPGADGKYDTDLMVRQIKDMIENSLDNPNIDLNLTINPEKSLKQLAKKHLRERSYYER